MSSDINKVIRILLRIERKIEYYLGTYSRYVGLAAEVLTQRVIEKTKKGGITISNVHLPPLEIIETNLRRKDYEIDILARDSSGDLWIIESTTYPILHNRQIDKFYNRVYRWVRDNNIIPNFILFAYGGIDHGLYYLLINRLKGITKRCIIFDKVLSEKLLAFIRSQNH